MTSKTILVTGATDGIGLATAVELSRLGHRMILHGRTPARLTDAHRHVRAAGDRDDHITVSADLSTVDAVFAMSAEIKREVRSLDVLINNAGVFLNDREVSPDGVELTFAVNHLSHFLLTHELLELLRNSRPSRIVNVSSVAHRSGTINFDDINSAARYGGYEAYAQSKLANVLFTQSLADRLAADDITANALHPGVIATKLLRAGFSMKGSGVEEGAATSVYLATSADVSHVTGKYFVDCVERPMEPHALDSDQAERLWGLSVELVQRARPGWASAV
ncbi:MAG: SDR family NAD(P)-dependent oxidoreductase [Rhodothermales bacterium]|nr:SDR family NAD(P)-dependent oxidoreductase [Rhodothermales bacterium]